MIKLKAIPIHTVSLSHCKELTIYQMFFVKQYNDEKYICHYEIRERSNSYIDNIQYKSDTFIVDSHKVNYNVDEVTKNKFVELQQHHNNRYNYLGVR